MLLHEGEFKGRRLIGRKTLDLMTTNHLPNNQDLTEIDDGLLDINRKVDVIRERYLEQFSAMESAVTNLKGTGEYLENMVKSWSKDDN